MVNPNPLALGSPAPDFDLPGVDGRNHKLADYGDKKLLAVVFSCNHCPYVVAYEERLMALQREFGPAGYQMVAINSNETVNYPQDSFDKMVERAAARKFNFPYLRDESQAVVEAYGGQCTPHVFLFDTERRLRYQGGIDDNWSDPAAVTQRPLREAIMALLEGRDPPVAETLPRGCSIKWG